VLPHAAWANINGFGDGSGYTLSANAAAAAAGVPVILSADELKITSQTPDQAASFFYNAPQDIGAFICQFDYQMVSGPPSPADGMAFVIQNDPLGPSALGESGHCRGYAGYMDAIENSFAMSLNLWNGGDARFARQSLMLVRKAPLHHESPSFLNAGMSPQDPRFPSGPEPWKRDMAFDVTGFMVYYCLREWGLRV